MKLSSTLSFCLLLVVTLLPAQDASARPNGSAAATRAAVAGMVTKDPGSEPVKKALIELISEDQSQGGNYTALTAADGSFQIEGIVPGRYRLYVERSGYLEVDKHQSRREGRVLTLTAGQELKDVTIHLQAAAVVEGRVSDEDGEALSNAQIAVQRQTFVSGRRHWEQAGAATTNDLGDYRIANLPAGSYYVSVTPPPDFKSLIESASNAPAESGKSAADKTAPASYATTYYPGTKDRGQASPIQLHAGDNFPANFSLTPSPSLVIRGSIANVPTGASAVVMLQSKDFGTVLNGAEIRKDGSFEIHDISPGGYTVLATVTGAARPLVARQSVQVISESLDGLRLSPQAGGSIHGRLRLEGRNATSTVDSGQVFLSLRSAEGDDDVIGALSLGEGFTTLARVAADGTFEWKDIPPGHYYVQLTGDGNGSQDWFLKSAGGGRDTVDTGLNVSGGVITIDLVASARGAAAEGIVTNAKGEPIANAVVVAVPEVQFRQRGDRFRKTLSDQSGRFTLRGLVPGQYTVLAWESMDGDAYLNPDFLKRFEGQGKAITLGESERKTVQLEAISPAGELTDQP